MENLINELVQKVGLSPEVAQKATTVVLEFVQKNLPESVKDKAGDLLNGKFDFSSLLSGLTGGSDEKGGNDDSGLVDKLKGMFGN
ncbi:hypothetical protein SAMN05216436_103117 [bacterium A37T11]|nr:hypothetical protein SAMN05216436_103117 [bacterium A37T11]